MTVSQPAKAVVASSLVVHPAILVPALALDALIVVSCWEDTGRFVAALVIVIVWGSANAALFPYMTRYHPGSTIAAARCWGNALGHLLKVVVSHAALPTWGWLVAFATMTDKSAAVFSLRMLMALLVLQIGVSAYFGNDWKIAASFTAIAVMASQVSVARAQALLGAVDEEWRQREETARANERLQAFRERAMHQERLTSLGLLAAGVAHEISNPMASVTSNVSQLARDVPRLGASAALRAEYATEILPETLGSIRRINTIVADLRRFARGDLESPTLFDLHEELKAALRMTHGRFPVGVEFDVRLDSVPLLQGHPRQLSQVLVNLLVNSAQAVAPGGRLAVRCGAEPGRVWFSIDDDGVGMSPDVLPRIFDPFFTTRAAGEGMGMGLAVVHGIITQLQGEIRVESQAGRGTRFTVWLPGGDLRPITS